MRIASDIQGLRGAAFPGMEVAEVSAKYVPSRLRRNLKLLRAALRSDYLVIHFSLHELLFFTFALFLIPGIRCRVVTVDYFAGSPAPYLIPFVRWSFLRAARLLVYFNDHQRFASLYRIPVDKFRYIPFKVNSWPLVQKTQPREEDFIFVGGRSRRDFVTLFEAIKGLPYAVKILTADEPCLRPHGSSLKGLQPPPNVEILYNDSDSRFFVDLMSRAKLVVLPIRKDATVQAGIGVCLLGMALQKCVIISEALGISDVLDPGLAVIVPPGDVVALRTAIKRHWEDDSTRVSIANQARQYAWSLGGEDSLRYSILRALEDVHTAGTAT